MSGRMSLPCLRSALAGATLLLAAPPALAACEGAPSNAKLAFTVENIRSTTGHMTATLYRADPATYLKHAGSLKVWRVPVAQPITSMCIWLPGPGDYALAVYQDLNDNQKFDHPHLGAIEPFGFSRNPAILFGAPGLGSTRFTAGSGETNLHVRLNYR